MGVKRQAWLAWTLCAIVVVFTLLGLATALAAPGAPQDIRDVLNQVMTCAYIIVFSLVGALILGRYARHTIGWLLMALALSLAPFGFLQSILEGAAAASPAPSLTTWLLYWLSNWTWWLLIGPLLLILLLFPTGRLLSSRWRWVVGMLAMLFVSFLFVATFSGTLTDTSSGRTMPNPLGIIPESFPIDGILVPWQITLIGTAAACVISVFVRYRRAASVEREQIKWFVCACAVFLCGYTIGPLAAAADPNSWFGPLFSVTILLIPLSIGVAILRYRLWDIDLLIRRTLIYGALTAMLALFYFGAVILLQQLFHLLTGQGSDLAVILSTLGIAALFVPLRSRAQRAIDRRFYRRKYDATHVLEAFGATVRDEVDLNRLTDELQSVVRETMQPEHVGVWLVRARKR